MKIFFCDKCNGKNILTSEKIEQISRGKCNCQICDRVLPQTAHKDFIDTSNFKLLFVDDDQAFLKLVEYVMSNDYSVSTTDNGADGLELALEIQPDLILLDIGLPDIKGYDLCRSMKRHENISHIPIFFITGCDSDIGEQIGFESGAVDYITKPISIQVLNAKIALLLRMNQLLC